MLAAEHVAAESIELICQQAGELLYDHYLQRKAFPFASEIVSSALTLENAADEALLRRASHGAAAEEAGSRSGMVDLQHLMVQHAASETELHARAAETWRKYASQLANSGCSYKGGLLPCPSGNICYYTGHGGLNVTATAEYRGSIIKTVLTPDPDAAVDQKS
ncbi:unnamed protein product [Prorocentrum cordatum]|uniref:Uncharacterized protein n=1 Tax=Prorocentrum cordatum TaxID=2364126 RepID=A0ABN9R0R7_9DINO|nr:unnamed protein product [Polarella glacialis]